MICSRKVQDDGQMNGGWCQWEFDWCVTGIRGYCPECGSEFDAYWDGIDLMENKSEEEE